MFTYSKISEYLKKCAESDTLSHSYIFYGPDEEAKKTIALKFAELAVKPPLGGFTATMFNPDLILISPDEDENRSLNLIRQLKKFLILSPHSGKHKIAVVEAFEKLNLYAQNAMLKILEEAPGHAVIILFAKTIDSVPKTIASRCVKLSFWRQNSKEYLFNKRFDKVFQEMLGGDPKNIYGLIGELADYKAIEIFKDWLWFLRIEFLSNPSRKLADILKISQNIYFKLNETNINPRFAYDELILNLWKF